VSYTGSDTLIPDSTCERVRATAAPGCGLVCATRCAPAEELTRIRRAGPQVLDRPTRILGTRRSPAEGAGVRVLDGGEISGGRRIVHEVASAAWHMSRGAAGVDHVKGSGGTREGHGQESDARVRARAARGGATPARPGREEDANEAVIAEQLAALHKRHIYDTSVLLQKEREILAMANRKGSSMSVSYLASLGRLLQQKAGMVTRLLSLLPASAAESLGIANESPRL